MGEQRCMRSGMSSTTEDSTAKVISGSRDRWVGTGNPVLAAAGFRAGRCRTRAHRHTCK